MCNREILNPFPLLNYALDSNNRRNNFLKIPQSFFTKRPPICCINWNVLNQKQLEVALYCPWIILPPFFFPISRQAVAKVGVKYGNEWRYDYHEDVRLSRHIQPDQQSHNFSASPVGGIKAVIRLLPHLIQVRFLLKSIFTWRTLCLANVPMGPYSAQTGPHYCPIGHSRTVKAHRTGDWSCSHEGKSVLVIFQTNSWRCV